ncbi:MAG: hypothetical protein L0Z62_19135 [Gemmataceae bacterium]|nr:hypothetical protein [Gemmataceae bacterium]
MPPAEDDRPLEDLLDSAGRVAQPTAFGWEALPARLAQTPQKPALSLGRWATLPLGVAAAATLLLALWFGLFTRDSEILAGPVEVRRQGVELTILSTADTDGETLYMPIMQELGRHLAAGVTGVRLWDAETSQRFRRREPPRRTGQALVKDRRLVLNLRKGDNVVRFTDVAASIDPTSVRFESRTDPLGTTVIEQSFEYDLATADALLRRYLDRKITCVGKDGQETTGRLAAFDSSAVVLSAVGPNGEGSTVNLSRRALRAVRLGELPSELITRPTLVWKLRTRTPGRHETVLTYICGFVKWRADYVVHVTPAAGKEPDRLDFSSWVTIENTSGSTYPQAGLRLIAGDINRVRDPWAVRPERLRLDEWYGQAVAVDLRTLDDDLGRKEKARPEFVQRSFFEYHLYALNVPSTIRDRQIKQLALLQRQGIKATRRYVYDPAEGGRHLVVELVVKNDKDNGLGLPLPKGRVTVEQYDRDGETAVVGRTEIDHTAVKEELELRYVRAFDVIGEHRSVAVEYVREDLRRTTYEMRVRNHKAEAIQVHAFALRLGGDDTFLQASAPHQRKDSATVHFDFALDANAERVIRYTIETREHS